MLKEAVQRVIDRAFGGVLYRHHTEMHCACSNFTEDLVNCRHRHTDHRVTKMLECSRLGKGAFRAEVGHTQRLFKRQTGRHDLTEQTGHFFVIERPLVQLHDVLEHPGFTFGAIEHRLDTRFQRLLLDLSDRLRTGCALTDQVKNLFINGVDALAQRLQLIFIRHEYQPCCCSNSAI